MSTTNYPPTGFRFRVRFPGSQIDGQDTWFQEVSGLTATLETESYRELGSNQPLHLPTGVSFSPLQLKRGLLTDSHLVKWCRKAIEDFQFEPLNLVIELLNEQQAVLSSWRVEGALPTSWSVSSFNAESSALVIESLELKYYRFKLNA